MITKLKTEYEEYLPGISERLRIIRLKLGLTMEKFAACGGLSKSLISIIESGHKRPPFMLLLGLYRQYKVNILYLFTGEGEMFVGSGSKVQNSNDDIDEMIQLMEEIPAIKYTMLLHFSEFMIRNQEIVDITLKEELEK